MSHKKQQKTPKVSKPFRSHTLQYMTEDEIKALTTGLPPEAKALLGPVLPKSWSLDFDDCF